MRCEPQRCACLCHRGKNHLFVLLQRFRCELKRCACLRHCCKNYLFVLLQRFRCEPQRCACLRHCCNNYLFVLLQRFRCEPQRCACLCHCWKNYLFVLLQQVGRKSKRAARFTVYLSLSLPGFWPRDCVSKSGWRKNRAPTRSAPSFANPFRSLFVAEVDLVSCLHRRWVMCPRRARFVFQACRFPRAKLA